MKQTILFTLCFCLLTCKISAQAPPPRPIMGDFIGVNADAKDDWRRADRFGMIREFHAWSSDVGYVSNIFPNLGTSGDIDGIDGVKNKFIFDADGYIVYMLLEEPTFVIENEALFRTTMPTSFYTSYNPDWPNNRRFPQLN
jgi:hypothetical protein